MVLPAGRISAYRGPMVHSPPCRAPIPECRRRSRAPTIRRSRPASAARIAASRSAPTAWCRRRSGSSAATARACRARPASRCGRRRRRGRSARRSGSARCSASCSPSPAASGLGFFTLIIAYFVGLLTGRATLRGGRVPPRRGDGLDRGGRSRMGLRLLRDRHRRLGRRRRPRLCPGASGSSWPGSSPTGRCRERRRRRSAAAARCDRSWSGASSARRPRSWRRRGCDAGGGPTPAGRSAGLEAFEGAPCWDHDRAQGRDAESR